MICSPQARSRTCRSVFFRTPHLAGEAMWTRHASTRRCAFREFWTLQVTVGRMRGPRLTFVRQPLFIIITNSQTSCAARSLNSVVTSRGVPAYCILLSIPRDHGTSTRVFRWPLCHEDSCVCLSWIGLVEYLLSMSSGVCQASPSLVLLL